MKTSYALLTFTRAPCDNVFVRLFGHPSWLRATMSEFKWYTGIGRLTSGQIRAMAARKIYGNRVISMQSPCSL